MITEIEGDLIELAKNSRFDVIAHGCNCFCKMETGLAPKMAEAFGCDVFDMENYDYAGDINKLGQIDHEIKFIKNGRVVPISKVDDKTDVLIVVNAYTQYKYGKNHADGVENPFDYEAFTLCMRKINTTFKDSRIGLPRIGAGLAGGDWERIKQIITQELKDCHVTIVTLPK